MVDRCYYRYLRVEVEAEVEIESKVSIIVLNSEDVASHKSVR